jgi:hypothetical protein
MPSIKSVDFLNAANAISSSRATMLASEITPIAQRVFSTFCAGEMCLSQNVTVIAIK